MHATACLPSYIQNVLAAVKSVQLPLASRQALYEQLAAKGFSTGGHCSYFSGAAVIGHTFLVLLRAAQQCSCGSCF